MLCNSWVITRKSDGTAVLETFQPSLIAKVNRDAYRVETAHAYLARINRELLATAGGSN